MKQHVVIPKMNDAYLSTRISITGIDSLPQKSIGLEQTPFFTCVHMLVFIVFLTSNLYFEML